MRPIRRAAVTGLFALWLAPLGATAAAEDNRTAASAENRAEKAPDAPPPAPPSRN